MKYELGRFVTTSRKIPKTGTITAIYENEKAAVIMCSKSCKYYTIGYDEIIKTVSVETAKTIHSGHYFPPPSAYSGYELNTKKRKRSVKKT